ENACSGDRSWTISVDGSRRGSQRRTRESVNAGGRVRSVDRRDLSRWRSGENAQIYFVPGKGRPGPTRGRTGRYKSQRLFAGTAAKHFAAESGLRSLVANRTRAR